MKWNFNIFNFFFNNQSRHGHIMVVMALCVPVAFSLITSIGYNDSMLRDIKTALVFETQTDYSHLTNYITFAFFHILLCIAIGYYCHSNFKKSVNSKQYPIYRANQIASFLFASIAFILGVMLFNTPLKALSFDLLQLGLNKLGLHHWLFTPSALSLGGFRLIPFYLIPILLVLVAFWAATAVMHSIMHLISEIDIDQKEPEDIIGGFMKEFMTYYYIIVGMFLSASIATLLYLRTPYIIVNYSISKTFTHLISSTLIIWCFIFLVVLLTVLAYTYSLLLREVRDRINLKYTPKDMQKVTKAQKLLNLNYMVSKYFPLVLSAFAPLASWAISQAIS